MEMEKEEDSHWHQIELSPKSQLSLMTTGNGKGFHTYSAYLTEEKNGVIAMRNMTFKLLLSYPNTLNPNRLLLGLHLDYYRHYYNRVMNEKNNNIPVSDSLKPLISKTVHHYKTLLRIVEENTGAPYAVTLDLAKKEINNPAFFFDRSFHPFFVSKKAKIEKTLRSQGTIQRLLCVDNHAIVAHFVEQFKKPFDMGGIKWDIHAMDYDQYDCATYVKNEKDAGLIYIMKQVPQFPSVDSRYIRQYKEKTLLNQYIINPVLPDMKSTTTFTVDQWRVPLSSKNNNQLSLNLFEFHASQFNLPLFVIDFKLTRILKVKQVELVVKKKITKKEEPIVINHLRPMTGKRSIQSKLPFNVQKEEEEEEGGEKKKKRKIG